MRVKKVGTNKYRTPSGATLSRRQLAAHTATKGFNKPYKKYKAANRGKR